jgi:large subunit ribosomal protein L17
MRHQAKTRRLGVKSQHRIAMLRNLTQGLVEHGRIRTTITRAKVLRPFVEKLVTRLKDPSVANLRHAYSTLSNRDTVMALAEKVSPKFKDRNGGYLRIMRMSLARPGDQADMALIEWVEESLVNAYQETKTTPAKKAGKAGKKAKAAKSDDADQSTDAKETAKTQKKAGKKETKKS